MLFMEIRCTVTRKIQVTETSENKESRKPSISAWKHGICFVYRYGNSC